MGKSLHQFNHTFHSYLLFIAQHCYCLHFFFANTNFIFCYVLSPRDWIQSLSAYATSSFLRAAELGAEISEQWVVANAAIYLWNYNNHLLGDKQHHLLLPTFKVLVDLLQKIQYTG